jgi:L-arabinose isomerase
MALQGLAGRSATIIEPFTIDESKNRVLIGHPCGCGAVSLAESVAKVHLRPYKPDEGLFVQFPIKSGPVTLANISGRPGSYRMLVATARSIEMSPDEWSKMGGIVAAIQFDESARSIMDRVIQEEGIDHHWVTVLGDLKQQLVQLCYLLDIRPVVL